MITRDQVNKSGVSLVMHARLSRGGVYFCYESVGFPRLTKTVYRERAGSHMVTSYLVDGHECADIDEVVKRLNEPRRDPPPLKIHEKLAASRPKPPPVTVEQMVAEVEYELRQRAKVYPRLAEGGTDADALAGHTRRMQAIRDFLKRCGELVRGAKPAKEEEPIADLLKQFEDH